MNLKIAAAAVALSSMSACGGANTGDRSFDTLKTDLVTLLDATEGFYDRSPENVLPAGEASYTGLAFATQEDEVTEETLFAALGTGRIVADFATGDLTGSASGFFEIEEPDAIDDDTSPEAALASLGGTEIEGEFSIEMSQTAIALGGFFGTATGSLTKVDGGTFQINGDAAGYVSGDNGERFYALAEPSGGNTFVIIAEKN